MALPPEYQDLFRQLDADQIRFTEAERILGVQFHNRVLLRDALKAPGLNQLTGSRGRRRSLQTRLLALVGDRFLALYMASLLQRRGRRSNWSKHIQLLVSNANLSTSLEGLGIQNLLQSSSQFHERTNGTVYEALLGAIYLDRGEKVAAKFIRRTLKGHPK